MALTIHSQVAAKPITATQPEFPYRAPPGTLPTEQPPSMDEILTSDEFYDNRKTNWTVRVGNHYVVKYGVSPIHIQEGQNMLFVRETTDIPVPTVYEMYKHMETGYYVLVMEFVPGVSLKSYWATLQGGEDQEERLRKVEKKAEFARQIRGYIQELRNLPSQGYYGGIWEQSVQDPILTFHELVHPPIHQTTKVVSRTEKDWCEMMIKAAEARNDPEPPLHTEWVLQKYRTMFSDGHEPRFTHCDIINRSNILVRPDGNLVPVAWTHAGWYPSYWEYCHAAEYSMHEDDWGAWIMEIFEGMEYVAELGWMMEFRERMHGLHWFCLQ